MVAASTSVFPASLDSPQAPTQFDTLATANVEHDLLHDWAQDAIKKLEAKLGIDSSPVTTTVDYILANHRHTGADHSAVPFTLKARAATGGTSLDLSDSINSSLRVKHPSSGITQFDVDSGNSFQWTVADAVRMSLSSVGLLGVQGGLDVTGSPSGYSGGEVRFPIATASAIQGLSTMATGSPRMQFDHRGLSNTGDFRWGNSTNASLTRMLLTSSGLLQVTGGLDVSGSPSGYLDEVRFSGSGGVHDHTISTSEVGSPILQFHHRGVSNTGSWNWANGTNAGTAQMTLSGAGSLAAAGIDHYFGPYAFGAGVGVSRLRVSNDAGASYINAEGDGANRSLVFNAKGSGNIDQYVGGVLGLRLASTGIFAGGTDHYLGSYSFGGTGVTRLHVGTYPTGLIMYSEGDGVNRDFAIQAKGTGSHLFYGDASFNRGSISSAGNMIMAGTISSGGTIQANNGNLVSTGTNFNNRLLLYNLSGTTDNKQWDFTSPNSSGDLVLRAINDAGSTSATALTFTRTGGTSINSIRFGASLMLPFISSASAPTPPSSFVTLFIDSTSGILRYKLSDGTLRTPTVTNP